MSKHENRPMLAASLSIEQLHTLEYPVIGSPKFDGIRMRVIPDLGGVSRVHKLLPNKHLQEVIREQNGAWNYFDGEIIVGDPTAPDCFNKTQSAIMSEDGKPDFKYCVFDNFYEPDLPYTIRLSQIKHSLLVRPDPHLELVEQKILHNAIDILNYEQEKIEQQWEGIILRKPTGKYKFGRSTIREGFLLKIKRFVDDEALIIDMKPLEHNLNYAQKDHLGYTKRSSHKANKVKEEMLGALICKGSKWTDEFDIGTGFTEHDREWFWSNKDSIIGQTQVSFRHQEVGAKDRPRFPSYKGVRKDHL